MNGVLNIANTAATNVKTAAQIYFTALNGLACTVTSSALSGGVLTQAILNANGPGVYCFPSSAAISSNLTLCGTAGQSYTFITSASTLTVGSGNQVALGTSSQCAALGPWGSGILNDNINWAIGSSATLGTTSTLIGIIDAYASITMNTGATLNGRAWALNGAVTLDGNAVSPQG